MKKIIKNTITILLAFSIFILPVGFLQETAFITTYAEEVIVENLPVNEWVIELPGTEEAQAVIPQEIPNAFEDAGALVVQHDDSGVTDPGDGGDEDIYDVIVLSWVIDLTEYSFSNGATGNIGITLPSLSQSRNLLYYGINTINDEIVSFDFDNSYTVGFFTDETFGNPNIMLGGTPFSLNDGLINVTSFLVSTIPIASDAVDPLSGIADIEDFDLEVSFSGDAFESYRRSGAFSARIVGIDTTENIENAYGVYAPGSNSNVGTIDVINDVDTDPANTDPAGTDSDNNTDNSQNNSGNTNNNNYSPSQNNIFNNYNTNNNYNDNYNEFYADLSNYLNGLSGGTEQNSSGYNQPIQSYYQPYQNYFQSYQPYQYYQPYQSYYSPYQSYSNPLGGSNWINYGVYMPINITVNVEENYDIVLETPIKSLN
jgi:hypothetical protein